MSSDEKLRDSALRVERARNRLQWQKRLLARTQDPTVRRIAERMVVTLGEIVFTLSETHDLLLERASREGSEGHDD